MLSIWTSSKFWLLAKSYFCNQQSRLLTTLRNKPLENIVGKGENAGHRHFLLFPNVFNPFPKQISIFQSNLFCFKSGPV